MDWVMRPHELTLMRRASFGGPAKTAVQPPVAAALIPMKETAMKQTHTEDNLDHQDGQQDTGNHKKPEAAEKGSADRLGGTRQGAENVEEKT